MIYGWTSLGPKRISLFLMLWFAGWVDVRLLPSTGLFLVPYVAVLDIALVFSIFKGDVRIT